MHFLLHARLARIEAIYWTFRIARERSLRNQRLIVIVTVPVTGPFPDVAGYVVSVEPLKNFHAIFKQRFWWLAQSKDEFVGSDLQLYYGDDVA